MPPTFSPISALPATSTLADVDLLGAYVLNGSTFEANQITFANFKASLFQMPVLVLPAIKDSHGKTVLTFAGINNAVNYISLNNATTGNAVVVRATGTDTDVSLNLILKGAGTFQINGVPVNPSGAIQLPQWAYEDGGGDPSGEGKFTFSIGGGGTLKMSKHSLDGYDASVILTNLQGGGIVSGTQANGEVSSFQFGSAPVDSGAFMTFTGALYGDVFSVVTYSFNFLAGNSVVLAQILANASITPFTGNSGGLNFTNGVCTGP